MSPKSGLKNMSRSGFPLLILGLDQFSAKVLINYEK